MTDHYPSPPLVYTVNLCRMSRLRGDTDYEHSFWYVIIETSSKIRSTMADWLFHRGRDL